AKVACVTSRDMHWAPVAHRDQRDVNLSSLRMLLVADGSNPFPLRAPPGPRGCCFHGGCQSVVLSVTVPPPGSISSCDAFLNVFQSKGLRSEVRCPCASSPEALTVAIRRYTLTHRACGGRGVLSTQDLSHGVIRIDSEEKLSVLTLQDVGSVMPGALMCTVKAEGLPLLCKADETGELVVCTVATGTSYYGLPGMTKTMFEVSVRPFFCAFKVFAPFHSGVGLLLQVVPVSNGGAPISAGLVFVAGKMDGLMADLSHGVIRIDSEEKLSVLTLQDLQELENALAMERLDLQEQQSDRQELEETLILSLQADEMQKESQVEEYERELARARWRLKKLREEVKQAKRKVDEAGERNDPLEDSIRQSYEEILQRASSFGNNLASTREEADDSGSSSSKVSQHYTSEAM
ncbi:unnamed protein product, partial [Tetraodon nigroviridis]